MAIKKTYLKNKEFCRVNFRLPKEVVNDADCVNLVGEFNDWDPSATPLKKMRTGGFSAEIDLPAGKEYQFKYLIDKSRWENDLDADKFVPTPFLDSQNCVVIL